MHLRTLRHLIRMYPLLLLNWSGHHWLCVLAYVVTHTHPHTHIINLDSSGTLYGVHNSDIFISCRTIIPSSRGLTTWSFNPFIQGPPHSCSTVLPHCNRGALYQQTQAFLLNNVSSQVHVANSKKSLAATLSLEIATALLVRKWMYTGTHKLFLCYMCLHHITFFRDTRTTLRHLGFITKQLNYKQM